jgi:hypothetical protein
MATVQDYRRTDLRRQLDGSPHWIVSNTIDGHHQVGLKDKACIMFSFPVAGQQTIIHEVAVQVLRGFTTGTLLELGLYSLATDGVSTGDTATVVDSDCLIESADIRPESIGWYYPTTGVFTDARGSGVVVAGENLIVGAASTVYAVAITPTIPTIIIGQAKVCMLISILPGS